MKHIKLFEQFDDYELDDIFGKDPDLKIVYMGGDHYIACNFREGGYFSLYDNYGGRYGGGDSSWNINPIIKDETRINVYRNGNWKNIFYKDLPKEIKDRL